MKYAPIDAIRIRNLIADIQNSMKEIGSLAEMSLKEFKSDSRNFGLAEQNGKSLQYFKSRRKRYCQ